MARRFGRNGDWDRAICQVWAGALGLDRVGIDDDLLPLGMDLAVATAVAGALRDDYGLDASAEELLAFRSVAEFADAHPPPFDPDEPSLVRLQPGGRLTPLFCVPGAGGFGLAFVPLARSLGPDRPVYAVQAPGLVVRAFPRLTLAGMARQYVRLVRSVQPHGPYQLAGHSAGGRVCVEMAHQLRRAGEAVDVVMILDTRDLRFVSGEVPVPDRSARLRRLPLRRFVTRTRLRHYRRVALAFRRVHVALLLGREDQYRALDYWYLEGFGPAFLRVPKPYDGRAVVFEADDDGGRVRADWHGTLVGQWETCVVPGGHLSMLMRPNVTHLGEAMDAFLAH